MMTFQNPCISGVFGWGYNLNTSNVSVTCVRQLNFMFVLCNFLSLENQDVPWKKMTSELSLAGGYRRLSRVVCLHDTSVYCTCLSVVLIAFGFGLD